MSEQSSPPSPTVTKAPRVTPDKTPRSTPNATPPVSLTAAERRGQQVHGSRFDKCSSFSTAIEESGELRYTAMVVDVTIIGEIIDLGGGHYNVPNGVPTSRDVTWTDVYRPAIVLVDLLVKGTLTADRLKLRILGGSVGCDDYWIDQTGTVTGTGRYAMFLEQIPDLVGNPVPELTVVKAWPMSPDGSVSTPEQGAMTVDDFVRIANSTPPPGS